MATIQEERAKAIQKLVDFKKTVPRGFKQIFSEYNITTVEQHIKADVEALLTPIKNEVGEMVSDFLSEGGLGTLIGNIGGLIGDIIHEIKKNEGLKLTIDIVSGIITGLAIALAAVIGFFNAIWTLIGDIVANFPPPPGSGDDLVPITPIIPIYPIVIPSPIFRPPPEDVIPFPGGDGGFGDDDGGFGWD